MPPLHDHSNSQAGDISSRDNAGRDIHKQGATGDEIRQILEGQQEFGMSMVAAYERLHRDLSGQIGALRAETRAAEQDAAMERGIGMEARIKQQERVGAELSELRRWLVILALVVLAIFAIELWLILDRGEAAGLVRSAYDLGLQWRQP